MIVFGKNVAKEVIDSNKKINRVFVTKNFSDRDMLNYFNSKKIIVSIMDKSLMDKKYGNNNQGIVLDIEDYNYYNIDDVYNSNFIVLLDHLEDPHNFGAIIRTCEAAGVDFIIIPRKRSVEVNSTVMKVSAGALNNIKIAEVNNLVDAIKKLKDNGFWIYATDMDGEDYSKIKYDAKTAIIIGSEGDGISRLTRENSDFIVSIPMKGKINSLNASVAAGIVIFEVSKQRK